MTTQTKEPDTLIKQAEAALAPTWAKLEEIKEHNQAKILQAFIDSKIQASHFSWVSGYGHDDLGKEKLDEVFARTFNTEAAVVRPHFVSGTHAITCAVLGNLKAGDEVVVVSGKPYDTLQTVFRSLVDKYKIVYKEGFENLTKQTKIAFIQRSRGYEWRDSYTQAELQKLIDQTRAANPNAIIFVDNCYGEFTQKLEPTDLGADLIAGSLIKNPGAGIAAAGGYVAGRKDLVHAAAEQLTAPGIGPEGGCMFDQTRLYFQGLFMAPLIVTEGLKGMSLAAKLFDDLGLETIPYHDSERNDLIQAIKFGSKDKLLDFCKLVQSNSPINSMFTPIADEIPGYDDQVVMASGTFIEGSTVELSADGPMREPYIGYMQGGLSYAHTKIVLKKVLKTLLED